MSIFPARDANPAPMIIPIIANVILIIPDIFPPIEQIIIKDFYLICSRLI